MADLTQTVIRTRTHQGVDTEVNFNDLLVAFGVGTGSATVQSVGTGPGLTGGPITVSGTISLASVGLTITQANQVIPAPADGATVTFDLSAGTTFHPAALGGNRTLALSNAPTVSPWAKPFTIILTQDATGSRTVTWFAGIKWAGGATPTLSIPANSIDAFIFLQIASGSYLGAVVGQAFA